MFIGVEQTTECPEGILIDWNTFPGVDSLVEYAEINISANVTRDPNSSS